MNQKDQKQKDQKFKRDQNRKMCADQENQELPEEELPEHRRHGAWYQEIPRLNKKLSKDKRKEETEMSHRNPHDDPRMAHARPTPSAMTDDKPANRQQRERRIKKTFPETRVDT